MTTARKMPAAPAKGRDLTDNREPDERMLLCIQNCLDCHRACVQTLTYCLQEGGEHAEADHVRLMLDCAQICQTAADFMLRGSALHAHVCGACAEVCQACADDCGRTASDLRMKACADTCRHCADSCRDMAATGAHPAVRPRGERVTTRHKTE
jgi:hypothetical protein